jgi:hypothetical protein
MSGTLGLAGVTSRIAGLGLAAKAGLGASLAVAGVAVAGSAGALPAAADHAVRDAIEVVSPLDFSEPGDQAPDRFGARVSADATGTSDGAKGVDGPSVAAEAPGAEHRADPAAAGGAPGVPGETGLARANETPAAPHVPETVPGAVEAQVRSDEPGADHPGSSDPDRADQHRPAR